MTDSTDIEGLLNQVETVRHYLHMQIGKPIKPELASAPEIALDQLKAMLAEAKLAAAIGEGMGTCQHCGGKKLGAVSTTEKGAAS